MPIRLIDEMDCQARFCQLGGAGSTRYYHGVIDDRRRVGSGTVDLLGLAGGIGEHPGMSGNQFAGSTVSRARPAVLSVSRRRDFGRRLRRTGPRYEVCAAARGRGMFCALKLLEKGPHRQLERQILDAPRSASDRWRQLVSARMTARGDSIFRRIVLSTARPTAAIKLMFCLRRKFHLAGATALA